MSAQYEDAELVYFGFPTYSNEGFWTDVMCLMVFLAGYRWLEYWMLSNNVVSGEYDFLGKCRQLLRRQRQ